MHLLSTLIVLKSDPMGGRATTNFVVEVFYGSALHENFTAINLVSAKSTPGAAL